MRHTGCLFWDSIWFDSGGKGSFFAWQSVEAFSANGTGPRNPKSLPGGELLQCLSARNTLEPDPTCLGDSDVYGSPIQHRV